VENNYLACYGPVRVATDPGVYSYYRISIDRITPGFIQVSERVTLRDIPIEKVNPEYLTDNDRKVVGYDSSTKILKFELGRSHPTYQMP